MIEMNEFLIRARVERTVVETWIEAGWLQPYSETTGHKFREIDIARAQLIQDLQDDMHVNDDGISIVLDLMDQLYGVRASLHKVMELVCDLPEDVRLQILKSITHR